MANPNVKKRIENISDEFERLYKHVRDYGISPKDIIFVRNVSVDLIKDAEKLIDECDAALASR